MNLVIKLEDFPDHYEIELQVELVVFILEQWKCGCFFQCQYFILFVFVLEDYANSSSDCCREGNKALHLPWDTWYGNNHMVLPTSS